MKKIQFTAHILPHLVAIAAFFIVTLLFFKPYFFDKKVLSQQDIQQVEGSARSLNEYRDKTGEEPLWVDNMFSGMPAYMVSVKWSNGPVSFFKKVLSLGVGHPVSNIFCSFVCYYILLLCFGIRPYLAIGAALAFGLSSYMIIGLSVGHNGRIGAVAFMPLVIAGVHLAFTNRKLLGLALTAAGLALQLRENHIQITYYMAMIIGVYGLVQLIFAIRENRVADFGKSVGVTIIAVILACCTFFGQFWAITEYSSYSIRGASDLVKPGQAKAQDGLGKDYAFAYNYGIFEPMTLLVPEFYGGSSMNLLVQDQKSESYQALVRSQDNQLANQLANYTSAYWGPQHSGTAGPYYAGAIIVFLFVVGILFADKKYVWWLIPLCALSLMLSWGDAFSSFNYFIFDYLPGYNKFRSVNFALAIILFAMPLLGMLGVEKILAKGVDKEVKKKLYIALGVVGGLLLLLVVFAGMASFEREGESQLPIWFIDALRADRKALFRADAIRSLIFVLIAFALIFFDVHRKISAAAFFGVLALIITIDIAAVDKRYFGDDNFQRAREATTQTPTPADQEVLKDKSYYRVYNLAGDPRAAFLEGKTSYFHHSIGGYHGAKIRRYQDLFDSCFVPQTIKLIGDARTGKLAFENYGVINMLNVKYILYGPERDNIIPNPDANGPAWFVSAVEKVTSANDELKRVGEVNTRAVAVVDESRFQVPAISADSTAKIEVIEHTPKTLKYTSTSTQTGLAVFSEIYYPKGWKATIDGAPVEILRADYVLRALVVPAGNHTIEFKFEPDAYTIGNKITMASSWLILLIVFGSLGWTFYKHEDQGTESR